MRDELAKWVLGKACNDWRREGKCYAKDILFGRKVLAEPHEGCVKAQEVHDILMGDPCNDPAHSVRDHR